MSQSEIIRNREALLTWHESNEDFKAVLQDLWALAVLEVRQVG